MARVYSDVLLRGGAIDSLTETVPEGYRWVVRDISIFWPGSEIDDVGYVSIVGVTQLFFAQGAGTSEAQYHWEGRAVMLPGDQLGFFATTLSWYVYISGYVLSLP